MKKLFYSINGEAFMITVSSEATPETAYATITIETGGNCLGPADDGLDLYIDYVVEHWDAFVEMDNKEADARNDMRNLQDITGQEAGIVIYDDEIIVCK